MKIFALICIVITAIGTFLPWYGVSAEAMGQSYSESINGFHYFSYGTLVFILCLISLIISFIEKIKKYRVFVMILSLIFSILPFLHHPETLNYESSYGSASAGFLWGLFVTVAFAAISVIIIYVNDYKQAKQ